MAAFRAVAGGRGYKRAGGKQGGAKVDGQHGTRHHN